MGPQIVPVQFRMLLVLRVCAECVCVCVCCKQKYVELNPCVRGFCVSELPAHTHAHSATHSPKITTTSPYIPIEAVRDSRGRVQ
jgi:hypothetical protein